MTIDRYDERNSEMEQTCWWELVEIDAQLWETECGERTGGDPETDDWKYCPYCGKKLELNLNIYTRKDNADENN